jgi:hypothetical protein
MKKLPKLLENFNAAKGEASTAAHQMAQIHGKAQTLAGELDGRLVPACAADVPGSLDGFMRRVKPDGEWFNQAAALKNEFIGARAAVAKARENLGTAEAALVEELNQLNAEQLEALRARRGGMVEKIVKFLLPYCDGDGAKASELACLCPAVTGLDFNISTAAVPVAPEIMAGRFLSTVS